MADEGMKHVDPIDITKKNSAFNETVRDFGVCHYNNQEYSVGMVICVSGTAFRCDPAGWTALGPC